MLSVILTCFAFPRSRLERARPSGNSNQNSLHSTSHYRNCKLPLHHGPKADIYGGRTTKIGIIGMGYVGLPLALLFSGEKFTVTGLDVDSFKVN